MNRSFQIKKTKQMKNRHIRHRYHWFSTYINTKKSDINK